jgi:peroxiredoxin
VARQIDNQTVAIVGVGGRDEIAAMKKFVERHDLDEVPNIADPEGDVWARFGVRGQPTWAFVDGQTGESRMVFGELGAEALKAELEKMAA